MLKQEIGGVPFLPDDLVKVNRGMNMVKVSVGEHQSEPAEVYIATARDGEDLSTYIVFYLTGPEVRALYGFDGNPYSSPRRIDVETEAVEFVEEMGAILEDIGWDSMSAPDREVWLDQQFLFPSEDELTEVDSDLEEVEEYEELEVIQTVEPLSMESEEVAAEKVETVQDEESAPDYDGEGKTENDDGDVKKALDGGEGKIVFAEDQFDEMLKKAFINPMEDAVSDGFSAEEVSSEESSSGDVSPGEPDPGENPEPPEVEDAATPTEAVKAEEVERSPMVEELSDADKILRFLSRM